jgi:transposase InsO family protein
MSSNSPNTPSDSLPSTVPKLDPTGSNWAIFSIRFQEALSACDRWGHFDGTKKMPESVNKTPSQEEQNAIDAWEKEERIARYMLSQKLPDSAVVRVHKLKTVAEKWAAVSAEYTKKGLFARIELRNTFMASRCPQGADVSRFLIDLGTRREELISNGVTIDDADYRATILNSIPGWLRRFASGVYASIATRDPTYSMEPDVLSRMVSEEYERSINESRANRDGRTHQRNDKKDDGNVALATSQVTQPAQGTKTRTPGVCWGCGQSGHMRAQCPNAKKGVPKSTGAGTPAGGTANAAEPDDDEADGVWAILEAEDPTETHDEYLGLFAGTSLGEDPIDNEYDDLPGLIELDEEYPSVEGEVVYRYVDDIYPFVMLPEFGVTRLCLDDMAEAEVTRAVVTEAQVLNSESGFDDDDNEVAAEVIAAAENAAKVPGARIELYDSGSTCHISPYRNDFVNFKDSPARAFKTANNQHFDAIGYGDLVVEIPNGVETTRMLLRDVLYAPTVGYTLVSIGKLDKSGFHSAFGEGQLSLTNPNGRRIGVVPRTERGLYRISRKLLQVWHTARDVDEVAAVEKVSLEELHRRMGHIAPNAAKALISKGLVTGIALTNSPATLDTCPSCVYGKATRQPVLPVREGDRATVYGAEVHSDVWGPSPVATLRGRRYYVSFTDDYSRETVLYLLGQKSGVFAAYREYEAWCKVQRGVEHIKVLHSDRGGEYMSEAFISHLKAAGTIQKLTVHDTPQHNGVAERLNRTLVERVRAMIHASGLPHFLWGEAVRHAVWLKNRTSTRAVIGKTPYEAATGKKPDLSRVREWGSTIWVHNDSGTKLDPRAREGRWIGIDDASKGARVYWPTRRTVTVERSIYYMREASSMRLEGETASDQPVEPDFDEGEPLTTTPAVPVATPVAPTVTLAPAPAIPAAEHQQTRTQSLVHVPVSTGIPQVSTRPRRERMPSRAVRDVLDGRADGYIVPGGMPMGSGREGERLSDDDDSAEVEAAVAALDVADTFEYALAAEVSEAEALEPRTLTEARVRADWPLWEKAIHEELETLRVAGTWVPEKAPHNANIVGCKWVFKAKKDAAGNVVRYKARLVAQGYSQVPGVDYFDTYAPVAKLPSVRTVLALANRQDMELHQVDIKGAYLNGDLTDDEVIYMRPPPGYAPEGLDGRVLRLKRTLYGLKQSGRRWYQKLTWIFVDSMGFIRCDVDQAVFFKRADSDLTIVVVHVDDCTVAATSLRLIDDFKARLRAHVEVTDLGELHWLLGIEIKRDRTHRLIHLSQRSYIDAVLRRYNLEDARPVSIPMDVQVRYTSAQSPQTTEQIAEMRDVPYREAVGSLMYLALATRPDIAFAVAVLSRFNANPGRAHWDAVKRVLRYLKGSSELWLTYGVFEGGEKLLGYTDADGSMAEDRRAVSGYAFLVDGGAVSWASKKQEIVSLSTTESEYVAAAHSAKEALWLKSLVSQLFEPVTLPLDILCDNQSAIALAQDYQYHARSKHIDVRYHFLRWVVDNGTIRLTYCPTGDMVADVLTKALPSPKVKHFATRLGLRAA